MSLRRRKIPKLIPIISFVILLVFIPVIYSLLRSAKSVEAAWADDSFSYRNSIAITSHTAAENNVYVAATIDTSASGQFQSDCGDLRFTNLAGDILPYYIVSGCTTASTVVHIFLDTMPAGAQTLYYYYGNAGAANGFSSGDFATQAASYAVGSIGSQEKGGAPVAYWKFDDGTGTTTQDSSPSNNDGTISGATWQSEDQCISGKCLYFDGSNDILTFTNISSVTTTGTYTISAWFNKVGATNGAFIDISSSGSNRNGIVFSGTDVLGGYYNGSSYTGKSGTYTANKWNHVVLVNSGGTITLYLNGIALTGTTMNSLGSTINQLGFNANINAYYNGKIDELKVYSYARTADQVKSDFISRGSIKSTSTRLGSRASDLGSLSNGLVGYWKMDEASWTNDCSTDTALDSSGNSNNGDSCPNSTGPTGGAVGKFGFGGLFDGSSDYISVANSTSLKPGTGDIAISAWVNPTTLTGDQTGIIKYVNGATYYIVEQMDDDTVALEFRDGTCTATSFRSTTTLTPGVWNHIVVVVDRDTQAWIYINGVLGGNSSNMTNCQASMTGGTVTIGGHVNFFDGLIDEARIYNRILSPKEIRDLYTFAPGPVGYWDFEEGQGTTIKDKSGNGFTGTLAGGTTNRWSTGKYGKAGNFDDANGDHIQVSDNAYWTLSTDFTLSQWVYFDQNPHANWWQNAFMGHDDGGGGGQHKWIFSYDSAGDTTIFHVNIAGGASANITSNTWVPALNTWYNVAVTRSGTTYTFYLNGVSNGSTTNAIVIPNAAAVLSFGAAESAAIFSGKFDDIRVYNYARTSKQIVEDMNGGHPAGGSPVGSQIGYWKFDEGYGATTYDSSPQGVHGTITNAVWKNDGKFDKSLFFDGTGDYVTLGNITAYKTDTKTITFWANPSSAPTATSAIVAAGNISNWYVGFTSSGRMISSHGVTSGCAQQQTTSPNTTVPGREWHHYAYSWTVSGSDVTVKQYKDGVKVTDTAYTTGYCATYGSGFLLGSYATGSNYYDGLADEIKIYNSALTDDEIVLDYNHGSAMVLGSTSNTSGLTGGTIASSSASATYCQPGATDTCTPPISEWNFEEKTGQTVYDVSGNANNITLGSSGSSDTNDPNWSTGKYGGGLLFDGSDNYSTVADATNMRTTSNWTREIWVKSALTAGGDGGAHDIWTQRTTSNKFLFRLGSTGTWDLWYRSTGAGFLTLAGARIVNQWQHLAAVKSGTNVYFYVDGILRSSATDAEDFPNESHQIFFGSSTAPSQYFPGYMDQARVYNYARTQSQIAWDYNQGKPITHFKIDECQGATLNDASGNGNNPTITIGGTGTQTAVGTCTTSGTAWFGGVTGKFNSSLNFDGTDDYASKTSPTNLPSGASAFSSSLWLKSASGTSNLYVLKWGTPATKNMNAIIYYGGTNSVSHAFYAADLSSGANTITNGAWNHILITWDGTTRRIYINGRETANDTPTSINVTANQTLWIATYAGASNFFPGQLDDIRIYNYALTPTQVKSIYTNGAINFGPSSGIP